MKRFFPYYVHLKAVRGHFFGAILFGLVYGAANGFGLPFMTKKVLPLLFGEEGSTGLPPGDLVLVDWQNLPKHFPKLDWSPWAIPAEHVLLFAVLLMPAVFAVRAVAQFSNTYLLNYVGVRVLEGVRISVFKRLQELHLDFFRKNQAGDLISRIMGDTAHIKTVVVDISNDLMIQPFSLMGALGYVIWLALSSPGTERFLLALALVPIVVLPIRLFGRKLAARSHQMLWQAGNLSAVLTESVQSPREIRAYNLQERETERFRQLVRSLFGVQMKIVKYEKMLSPLIEFVCACSISFAIYQASQVNISQETVLSLVVALYVAYEPIKKLGAIHNKIKAGTAGLVRIEEILHAPIEVADPAKPVPLRDVHGAVRFENLTFAYAEEPVLRDVNISVKPGEIVALVGPSGAGKSTFANLVPRFYDPQSGNVCVDGVNVRNVLQSELRDAIALVSQEPILFDDSVYNNILLGRPNATREEVYAAAEKAGARQFIEAFDTGWETRVGERGGRLSGGQRQRIAIARAFLKNAPILILDEATSALDSESEALVQAALEKLVAGKTAFIIAHRFSTIRFATRILVFEAGKIVADGTHADLLQRSPLYKALYERQAEK